MNHLLPLVVTDELETHEANNREYPNEPSQQTKTCAHGAHYVALNAVELQDVGGFTILAGVDGDLAILLALKLIDHHGTPGVAQERRPGEPVPSYWDLVEDDELRHVMFCKAVAWNCAEEESWMS